MQEPQFGHIQEIDLNHLTPRLHNNCWVVADSRKWHGHIRYHSLVQGGAIWSEKNALEMADRLNEMVYRNTFGPLFDSTIKITGPFYAYRLATAIGLGFIPTKQPEKRLLVLTY